MRARIEHYLRQLEKFEVPPATADGMSVWICSPYGTHFRYELSVTRCTSSAMMIAYDFGGTVWGYEFDDNTDKNKIAFDCGGHDFAIVGKYLVDYWAKYVDLSAGRSILDLTDPGDIEIVIKKYLPLNKWVQLDTDLWGPLK